MAVNTLIGAQIQQQGTVRHWTFFEGETQVWVFKGQRDQIQPLYESYKLVAGFTPTYDDINYDPGKGLATLTLKVLGDGQTIYELSANELSNPIQSHPYFVSLSANDVKEVMQQVQVENGKEIVSWSAEKKQLFRYLMHGVTDYYVSQYVLRQTQNLSKRSTVTAAYTNVNLIDTLPNVATVNTLLGIIPAQEWLKKAPVVRQIGNQRWQIITEWWGDLKLSKILYGGTLEYTS